MSHSTSFSFQIGCIQNEDLKKVHPFIRLFVIPIVLMALTRFYLEKIQFWSWDHWLTFSGLSALTLLIIIHFWSQFIQIVRFHSCYGDVELYFENGKFILIEQQRKDTVLTKFDLSDIEEFNLFENNSEVFIKVNSEIFAKKDGSKINSIRLKYLGDLSFALMIIEKITSAKTNGKDHGEKVLDFLEDIMRELTVTRFKNVPITNLQKNISLNQRFSFCKGLFNSDNEKYKLAIEQLNNSSKSDAFALLTTLSAEFGWSSNSPLVFEFTQLVNRRFL